jgi:hypothetical protein
MEKKLTCTLSGPGGYVIGDSPSGLIEAIFGDDESVKELFNDLAEGEK